MHARPTEISNEMTKCLINSRFALKRNHLFFFLFCSLLSFLISIYLSLCVCSVLALCRQSIKSTITTTVTTKRQSTTRSKKQEKKKTRILQISTMPYGRDRWPAKTWFIVIWHASWMVWIRCSVSSMSTVYTQILELSNFNVITKYTQTHRTHIVKSVNCYESAK